MDAPADLNPLNESELRQMAARMLAQLSDRDARLAERYAHLAERDARIAEQSNRLAEKDAQLAAREEVIRRSAIREEQLTHEIALLRRHRFGKRSEGINRRE